MRNGCHLLFKLIPFLLSCLNMSKSLVYLWKLSPLLDFFLLVLKCWFDIDNLLLESFQNSNPIRDLMHPGFSFCLWFFASLDFSDFLDFFGEVVSFFGVVGLGKFALGLEVFRWEDFYSACWFLRLLILNKFKFIALWLCIRPEFALIRSDWTWGICLRF